MKTRNFPAKVLARQKAALVRLSNKPENENEKIALTKAISSIFGNPKNLRSKKDRSDRAKI